MRKAIALVLFLAGAVAAGAQASSPQVFDDSLVVTAGLEEAPRDEMTAAVTVVEADEIDARQAASVADLLATVPGLAVARSGSAGKLTSLFVRGTESDHALVLWNGIELNNPYFGGFDWAFLPTEGVDRVEIVRGPFSAVHGAEAVGGVIQILTKVPAGGSLKLESGRNSYRRAGLAAGVERRGFELDITGSVRRGDGLIENDFFSSDDVMVRGSWTARDDLTFGVVSRLGEAENGIPLSLGIPSPRRRIFWRERQLALPTRWQQGSWEIEGRLSYVEYHQVFSDPDDAFGFTGSDTDSSSGRLRAQAARRFEDGSWLAFGAELESLAVDDRSVFGVSLDGARQQTSSVFIQTARDAGPLRLDLGLRHDENDVFGGKTTPRAGLLLRLGTTSRMRVAWGQGFRAPSLGELFYPLSGNAELAPEESRSWEIGIEHDARRWRLGASAFDSRLRNLIDFDFTTFSNVNIGRARARGLELWGRYAGRTARARVNLTLLDAVDRTSGERLLRRPEVSAAATLTLAPTRWTVSLTGRYVGKRPDVDPTSFARLELDEFVRFDLGVRHHWRRAIEPYLRIENVGGASFDEVAGFPAAGREVIAGLALRWGRAQ